MKRVRVTLEVDSHFVKLLNFNVSSKEGGFSDLSGRDVASILACIFLLEARGATSEQIHMTIPPLWRPHIEAISDMRQVKESPHAE